MLDHEHHPVSIWRVLLSPFVLILVCLSLGSAIWFYLSFH